MLLLHLTIICLLLQTRVFIFWPLSFSSSDNYKSIFFLQLSLFWQLSCSSSNNCVLLLRLWQLTFCFVRHETSSFNHCLFRLTSVCFIWQLSARFFKHVSFSYDNCLPSSYADVPSTTEVIKTRMLPSSENCLLLLMAVFVFYCLLLSPDLGIETEPTGTILLIIFKTLYKFGISVHRPSQHYIMSFMTPLVALLLGINVYVYTKGANMKTRRELIKYLNRW